MRFKLATRQCKGAKPRKRHRLTVPAPHSTFISAAPGSNASICSAVRASLLLRSGSEEVTLRLSRVAEPASCAQRHCWHSWKSATQHGAYGRPGLVDAAEPERSVERDALVRVVDVAELAARDEARRAHVERRVPWVICSAGRFCGSAAVVLWAECGGWWVAQKTIAHCGWWCEIGRWE